MSSSSLPDRDDLRALRRAVVKISTVSDPPDYEQPWQTLGVEQLSGSGVVVRTPRGLRVLTSAHVVENEVFIEVRSFGRTRKYVATVEGIDHDCDLALLRVQRKAFFRGTEPMEIGDLPDLMDHVAVLGFPIGGDRLSITEGIVSRIEMSSYTQSQRSLLAIQIDAAINSGNSGGPVVMGGKLVGIAFQALEDAENIGYVIPAPVIRHFLADLEDGRIDGFPSLGLRVQVLESRAHRRALGLAPDSGGVLVNRVVYEGSCWEVVRRGDILLSIDGAAVAPDGTVRFRRGQRIEMGWLASRLFVGDRIAVEVWRGGVVLTCTVTLRPPQPLVPWDRHEMKPDYVLYGGLLFVPLTRDYLKTWGEEWRERAPRRLMTLYRHGLRTPERHEVVMLQKVLADDVNRGYHDVESVVIERAQGTRVASLAHLVRILESTAEPYVRFVTDDGEEIVLDRHVAVRRQQAILRRYGVPRDASDGILPDEGAAA
jgi:S1-C subfamily serine protease